MSEKLPQNKYEPTPVLVPRGNGEIQVMHSTGEVDENGRIVVVGQTEEIIDGRKVIPQKAVRPEALSEEVQAKLADELAMSRNPSEEELDRHGTLSTASPEESSAESQEEDEATATEQIEELKQDFSNSAEMIKAGKYEYDRQIGYLMETVSEDSQKAAKHLENFIENSSRVLARTASETEEVSAAIKTLVNNIDYQGYTASDVRVAIDRQQLITRLNSLRNLLRSEVNEYEYTERSVDSLQDVNRETISLLNSREAQFESFMNQTAADDSEKIDRDDYSTDDQKQKIHQVNLDIESLREATRPLVDASGEYAREIEQVVRNMDIINETVTRHNHLDPSALLSVANSLKRIFEDRSIQRSTPSLLEQAARLRANIANLSE